MINVIPAIDVIGGRCVRLTRGSFDTAEFFEDSPLDVARRYADAGFRSIHPIDLAGTKAGRVRQLDVLEDPDQPGADAACLDVLAASPATPEAMKLFRDHRILYAPGKAANAGGAAVSGLEMAQNSMHYAWTSEEVDQRLQIICFYYKIIPQHMINMTMGI